MKLKRQGDGECGWKRPLPTRICAEATRICWKPPWVKLQALSPGDAGAGRGGGLGGGGPVGKVKPARGTRWWRRLKRGGGAGRGRWEENKVVEGLDDPVPIRVTSAHIRVASAHIRVASAHIRVAYSHIRVASAHVRVHCCWARHSRAGAAGRRLLPAGASLVIPGRRFAAYRLTRSVGMDPPYESLPIRVAASRAVACGPSRYTDPSSCTRLVRDQGRSFASCVSPTRHLCIYRPAQLHTSLAFMLLSSRAWPCPSS